MSIKLSESFSIRSIAELLKVSVVNNAKRKRVGGCYNIVGTHGIGKTAVIGELAKDLNLPFVHINVSQTNVDEFAGYPVPMLEVVKGEITKWIVEKAVNTYLQIGYIPTGNMKVVEATPEWVQRLDSNVPIILLLDDDKRYSDARMGNALMEIKNKGRFNNWSLPLGSTVISTSNPDDEDYQVVSGDAAQEDRQISFKVHFNIEEWKEDFLYNFLDKELNDVRILDFINKHPEILTGFKESKDEKEVKRKIVTCRKMTSLITELSYYDNWENLEQLSQIKKLLSNENPTFATLFASWVLTRDMSLLSIKEMNNLTDVQWNDYMASKIGRHDVQMMILNRYVSYLKNNEVDEHYQKALIRLFTYKKSEQYNLNKIELNPSLLSYITNYLYSGVNSIARKLSADTKKHIINVDVPTGSEIIVNNI